ncbi:MULTISPECIES: ankyrin repeat domain-containing protein [Candidatus Cardinium]|uniref:ankyrin repeat domain-containing protein n=1 Tax=Candidatus Cardinium TaxID=273135 RepID=UPI001FAAD814|nr:MULTISPECIES: ankyrin repeat domain-containing protein [Cardinium]
MRKIKMVLPPIYIAVREGHVEVVKALLATNGIQMNAQSKDGLTPLHLAAYIGHIEVVKELLSAPGILVNKKIMMAKLPFILLRKRIIYHALLL